MSLTQSQVDSILELRQKYLACWVKMIEGRADLEQELQVRSHTRLLQSCVMCMQACDTTVTGLHSVCQCSLYCMQSLALTADSSISQSGQQKTLHDLAERLAKLWQETHAAIVPFFKSVTLQVRVDPFQGIDACAATQCQL